MTDRVEELSSYPRSAGKIAALKHFKWLHLTPVEEVLYAKDILTLAKLIDEVIEDES